ncbi:MAG TPA: DNA repair and recombination protein RadB [Thermoplasmata archaeon]|nr:DNA repair and recombination protein RadB [Thermoplasmata archaeon]
MAAARLSTGVASVDRLLGGGLETDGLTELYGEGGSGKTIFCLDLASRVAREGRWVFYVDTEGLSLERLRATAGGHLERILGRLLVSAPKDLDEQLRAVETACALARDERRDVGLVVVDSATNFYRLSIAGADEEGAREALAVQLAELVATARARGIAAVVTNQVWRSVRDGQLEPLGGSFLNHVAKTILRFDRGAGAVRTVTLVKHRSLPEGVARFRIAADRLESLDGG